MGVMSYRSASSGKPRLRLASCNSSKLRGPVVGSGTAAVPLPPLSKIFASHALIHAAEGEFFREAFSNACESLGLSVTGFRERNLDECVQTTFGKAATRMWQQISTLGRSLGPPWTKDQKTAALAALVLLANNDDCSNRRPEEGSISEEQRPWSSLGKPWT